jgi:hypothetical protein
MHSWFLLAGNDPDKLKILFVNYISTHSSSRGIALWKWKKTCWICSPDHLTQDILRAFVKFGITEFSSAPSPSDLEFIHGDRNALRTFKSFQDQSQLIAV